EIAMTTISEAEIRITEEILTRTGEMLAELAPRQAKNQVLDIVRQDEEWRGRQCINLLAPEALMSPTARRLLSSELSQRAGEGEIGNRWFAGTRYIDDLEALCVELAKQLFRCNFADHRMVSGMVSNTVVYFALAQPGDVVMSLPKPAGGHSSNRMDGPAGLRGCRIVDVPFDPHEMTVDVEAFRQEAERVRPRLIALGSTLTLFPYPVREMKAVAEELGAHLYFDGAHQLGLIAAGQFQDALGEGADVLTGSTGKTLSGPQGGLILWNEPALTGRLRWAVFPGMAATHQINRVAALAVSLAEMLAFGREYMAQIVANSQSLAGALHVRGFNVLAAHKGYTQTHQVAVHVGEHGGGYAVAERLARANIIVNKNLMPTDTPETWDRPSGIRLGTTEVTRLGMKAAEMEQVAGFIHRVLVSGEAPEQVAREVTAFRAGFQTVGYCFDA
ncbi:MAG: serine hydroxymethyltransferase, partial [Anaerolineae bacterium]